MLLRFIYVFFSLYAQYVILGFCDPRCLSAAFLANTRIHIVCLRIFYIIWGLCESSVHFVEGGPITDS